MSAPRNTAEAVHMAFLSRWPNHPLPQWRNLIWPWLEKRRPPEPPGLGLDELDLLVKVMCWAGHNFPKSALAKIAQEG